MKRVRQNKILELIDEYDIDTQEELGKRLHESGFRVTQATISRDIKELQLKKQADKNRENPSTSVLLREVLVLASAMQEFYKMVW